MICLNLLCFRWWYGYVWWNCWKSLVFSYFFCEVLVMICWVRMLSGCIEILMVLSCWVWIVWINLIVLSNLLWVSGKRWFLGVVLIEWLDFLIFCRNVVIVWGELIWYIRLIRLILIFNFKEVVDMIVFSLLFLRCCFVLRWIFLERLLWWLVIVFFLSILWSLWVICFVSFCVLMKISVFWWFLISLIKCL